MNELLRRESKFPLSFGGGAVSGEGGGYGFGAITEDQSLTLLRESYERGFRIFDSAPIYGFGVSEQRIGKAFKSTREKVFIVSKCGVSWHPDKRVNMTNDPQTTQKMIEQSLRDLNSDYMDLYMVHWPDQKVDIRKTVEVIAKAKRQGKIKHIGLCNTYLEDLQRAQEIETIEVVQGEFNVFKRDYSTQLFDYLSQNAISFMSWGTLDKGIISGTVDEKRKFTDKSDCRSWAPWWKDVATEKKFKTMKKISARLQEIGHSGLELALGHNLSYPALSTAIVGIKSIAQLESTLKALEHLPTPEQIEEILSLVKREYA
ncbi:MAG: aldo/keto reductase [Pseudomonadota bacterium]